MTTHVNEYRSSGGSPPVGNKALEPLLNEHDVARITGLSVASVRRWRQLKQGPKYIKLGSAVRYKPEEVSAWLDARPGYGGQERGID